MDVFVIPFGRDRYELYCESSSSSLEPEPATDTFVGRLRHRFSTMLHAAEERRQRGVAAPAASTLRGRMQDRLFAWVAEHVAEQRLLWNLRSEPAAEVAHPQDMSATAVLTLVRRQLQHDFERHRRWMIIDGIAFVVTFVALGPLFLLIPGVANLPAVYFGFRAISHWLSMRGAGKGLNGVTWTTRVCEPLDELRPLAAMEPAQREAPLRDIATRLRLSHLATFFERIAIPRG